MKSRIIFQKIHELLCFMARKTSQTRLTHSSGTPGLKDISDRLTKIHITSKTATRKLSASSFSVERLIESIKAGRYKRIVVLAGAGISTPSGIPDFRSPGTGLYDNLQRYNIPYPEAIFELSYFHRNPQPFFHLAKELYPGRYLPNIIHYFIRYLHDQNVLHRVYTQNIDGLERAAGIPVDKIVEAHGTFLTATCQRCRRKYECEDIRQQIFDDQIPKCSKTPRCTGIIKPDIVFFGEDLPRRFQLYSQDLPMCDCCIVMGTSLGVYPFADIVDATTRSTARLLINRQIVGTFLIPRPFDMTMIGDLELNVKQVLRKLDAIEQVMELMKRENGEKEKHYKPPKKTSNSNANDERLKSAETFVQQRRNYSSLTHRRPEPVSVPQSKLEFNESTKRMIEKHNDALLKNRRRSKSVLPAVALRQLSSSSSSSSSESLDSSLSERELSPFAFKRPSNVQIRSTKIVVATPPTKLKRNPLLNATLRT